MPISFSSLSGGGGDTAYIATEAGTQYTIDAPAGAYRVLGDNDVKLNESIYARNSEFIVSEDVTTYEALLDVNEEVFQTVSEGTGSDIIETASGKVNGNSVLVGMTEGTQVIFSNNQGNSYQTLYAGVSGSLRGCVVAYNKVLLSDSNGNVYEFNESGGGSVSLVYSSGQSVQGKNLKYVGDKVFMMLNNNTVSYTSDGVNWSNFNPNTGNAVYHVWYDSRTQSYEFQGYAANDSSRTTDFQNFTSFTGSFYGGSRFGTGSQDFSGKHRMLCTTSNNYYVSDDYGETWRDEGSLPNTATDTFTDGIIWIAVGAPYQISTSRDGYTWTGRAVGNSGTFESCHAGEGRILLGSNVDPELRQSPLVPFLGSAIIVQKGEVL